jgi:hypothetical protein
VPAKVFQGTKKSAAFIPVEEGLCRHISKNAAVCNSRHRRRCQ